MSVLLETSLGDIVIDLEVNKIPTSSSNFLRLAYLKLLNNLVVTKIDKDYLCIFGSSTEDAGSAEYQFSRSADASLKYLPVERHEKVKHSKFGTVGMVNGGQSFYITLKDGPIPHLDAYPEKTTVIGYVEDGLEVLEKLNTTVCDNNQVPYNTIRVRHCVLLDDAGEIAKSSKHRWFPSEAPASPDEIVDELLGEIDQEDAHVVEERQKDAVAKARQIELELMGDLPSADIRPPNNVLFVCQLNPITEDDDLRTVFARFGQIKKCEIIRDFVTGDSLQYAFIEFEKEDSCNKAYVAMQNVLIDDKRIKVDFSQSVSKLWNEARRRGARTAHCFDRKSDSGAGHSFDRKSDSRRSRSPQRREYRPRDQDRDYRDHRYGRERDRVDRYGRDHDRSKT